MAPVKIGYLLKQDASKLALFFLFVQLSCEVEYVRNWMGICTVSSANSDIDYSKFYLLLYRQILSIKVTM